MLMEVLKICEIMFNFWQNDLRFDFCINQGPTLPCVRLRNISAKYLQVPSSLAQNNKLLKYSHPKPSQATL